MSMILDALKKSENERKRQATPSIADVRSAPPAPSAPRWLWWVLALLGANLLALTVFLLRPAPADVPAAVNEIRDDPPAAQIGPPAIRPPKEEVRSLATEAAGPAGSVPVVAAASSTSATLAGDVSESRLPSARVEALDNRPELPMFEELRAGGRLNLATLHIDLHVHHSDPARRLVYINGKKYSEGDTLSEGPRVLGIRSDGAVLSYHGMDFLLPRD